MKKLIIFMAAVLMMSAAFTGCDNSSSSSESGKKKGFTIEAQIEYPEDTVLENPLYPETKDNAFLTVDWEGNKNPIKEVEVDIYFGGKKIGEVDFAEDFDPYDGLHFSFFVWDKELNSISKNLQKFGTYTLKIKAEDKKGNESNTVTLTLDYTNSPN